MKERERDCVIGGENKKIMDGHTKTVMGGTSPANFKSESGRRRQGSRVEGNGF